MDIIVVIFIWVLLDIVGLICLEKKENKAFVSLGCPKWYWNDFNKIAYVFAYVGMMRFIKLESWWVKSILFVECVIAWVVIIGILWRLCALLVGS